MLRAFDLQDENVVRVVVRLETLRGAGRRDVDVALEAARELRFQRAAQIHQRRERGLEVV
jgi:hypothetical protein